MAGIPIALQLYSIREDCAKDFSASLKAVADMGYDGVEFAGYHGMGAADLRSLCDDLGLRVAGTHTGLDTLLGDALEPTIEFNQAIGNRFLIVPGLAAEHTESIDAWKRTVDIFNGLVDKAAPHGMYVGYHNHFTEFAELDGEVPWDVFFGGTRQEVVMQLDTGNAMHGGGVPVPYVERYPGRALTVHLKEYSAGYDKALIGEGDVPWADLFRLCDTIGNTEWYIIEQESYALPPMECVDACLKNTKKLLAG